jgi:hypothetical protein
MNKFYLGGVELVSADKLKTISFESESLPDYVTSIYSPLSTSEEMSFECEVNPQLFERLTGVDLSQHRDLTSFTIACVGAYQVQVRRHKKKRINKKWAKRYGYKTKFKTVIMTDAQFKQGENDFEFEFTGRHMNVF